jgi:hypothetical protein
MKPEKGGGGRDTTIFKKEIESLSSLKVPRLCPLVFLMGWR